MIREWRLRQFKSVGRRTEKLPFKPLTLFSGANSSGKSSIIQSILLICQTLASKVSGRHLALNGDLVKLGTFADVLHDGSTDATLEIGFSLELAEPQRRRATSLTPRRFYGPWYSLAGVSEAVFDVDLDFSRGTVEFTPGSQRPNDLQAHLVRGTFATNLEGTSGVEPHLSPRKVKLCLEAATNAAVQMVLQSAKGTPAQTRGGIESADLRYTVTLNPRYDSLVSAERASRSRVGERPEIVSAVLEHFLPGYLVNRFPLVPRLVAEALDELQHASSSLHYSRVLNLWRRESGDAVKRHLADMLASEASANQQQLKDYLRELLRSRVKERGLRGNDKEAELVRKVTELSQLSSGEQYGLEYVAPPGEIGMLVASVGDVFGNIRYLGPLRDDPKPVYGIASSADPSDVGVKGEFTAAVLDLYSEQLVRCTLPTDFLGQPRSYPLKKVVQDWLHYFGLAEAVVTSEEGKLGHSLWVRPAGISRDVDLTNVGVGVSQVLPIVVMSLMAEPGSVLLFEQPELHLHPRVQSRLGDFFLAMSRTGRQCVVETHSEYLINRLRLRVAESRPRKALHDDMIIYFVERDETASRFLKVEMNEYGAIPDWPRGFFDQGPDEAERIVRAAREKRNSLRQLGQEGRGR